VPIDGIRVRLLRTCRLVVRDNLVAEEIEVDPLLRTAAFGTPQHSAVKMTGRVEIVDGESKMKRSKRCQSLDLTRRKCRTSDDTCDLNPTASKTLVIPRSAHIAEAIPTRPKASRIDPIAARIATGPRGPRTMMTGCFTIRRLLLYLAGEAVRIGSLHDGNASR